MRKIHKNCEYPKLEYKVFDFFFFCLYISMAEKCHLFNLYKKDGFFPVLCEATVVVFRQNCGTSLQWWYHCSKHLCDFRSTDEKKNSGRICQQTLRLCFGSGLRHSDIYYFVQSCFYFISSVLTFWFHLFCWIQYKYKMFTMNFQCYVRIRFNLFFPHKSSLRLSICDD